MQGTVYSVFAHCERSFVFRFAMGSGVSSPPPPPPPICALPAATFSKLWIKLASGKRELALNEAHLLLTQTAQLAGKAIPESEVRKWLAANHRVCAALDTVAQMLMRRLIGTVPRDVAEHLFDAFTSEYGIPRESMPGTLEAVDAETLLKSAKMLT